MNASILKLPPDEWQKYRSIRLLALKADPYAFSSSYAQEVNLTEFE